MSGDQVELVPRHINALESAFRDFWFQISGVPGSPARPFEGETIDVRRVDEHHLSIRTAEPSSLWFRPLPYRPGNTSKVIDARIQFRETVRGIEENGDTRFEIIESVTSLQHVTRITEDGEKRVGEARQGIHFDFKEFPDEHHPVFHAHFDPGCIKDTDDDYADEFRIPDFSAPDFPRIPSAPVDVAGATYMLLHDHKPDILEDDKGWPSQVHSAVQKLPRFPESCFQPIPQDGAGMFCDWWYVHATFDDDGVPKRRVLSR